MVVSIGSRGSHIPAMTPRRKRLGVIAGMWDPLDPIETTMTLIAVNISLLISSYLNVSIIFNNAVPLIHTHFHPPPPVSENWVIWMKWHYIFNTVIIIMFGTWMDAAMERWEEVKWMWGKQRMKINHCYLFTTDLHIWLVHTAYFFKGSDKIWKFVQVLC